MTDDRVIDYVANRLLKSWFPHTPLENVHPRQEWEEAAQTDARVAIESYLEYVSDDRK